MYINNVQMLIFKVLNRTLTIIMASEITVKVKMLPMYVDYLKAIYYSDNNQVAIERTKLSTLVKELLTKPPEGYELPNYPQKECVELILPNYHGLDVFYSNYLSENSQKIIRNWVREKFLLDLHDHVDKMSSAPLHMELQTAIIHFCDLHEIHPDHYKVNSLYKDYHRKKKSMKSAKKRAKISLSFAAVLSIICQTLVLPLSFL